MNEYDPKNLTYPLADTPNPYNANCHMDDLGPDDPFDPSKIGDIAILPRPKSIAEAQQRITAAIQELNSLHQERVAAKVPASITYILQSGAVREHVVTLLTERLGLTKMLDMIAWLDKNPTCLQVRLQVFKWIKLASEKLRNGLSQVPAILYSIMSRIEDCDARWPFYHFTMHTLFTQFCTVKSRFMVLDRLRADYKLDTYNGTFEGLIGLTRKEVYEALGPVGDDSFLGDYDSLDALISNPVPQTSNTVSPAEASGSTDP